MKKIPIRQIRWGRIAVVLIAAALLLAGMMSCYGLVHYNGTVYRKRVVLFALMVLVSMALAAYAPPESRRWKHSRLAYVILGIVAGGMAFQWITCAVSYEFVIRPVFIPLMIVLSAIIYLIVWLIVWDSRRAVITYYWLMCLLGYAYECVYLFRGVAFKPADILSWKTALSVAGDYQFTLEADLLFWCLGGVMLWSLSGWVKKERVRARFAKMVKPVGLLLAAGWIWLLISTNLLASWNVVTTAFEQHTPYENRQHGTLVTLLKECQQLKNLRPGDYQASELAQADEWLMQPGIITENEIRPNVLVIMNESLSDLGALWQIDTTCDPLSYLHTLTENTVYGNLYVSSYGGSTSNSEHSFLTATAPAPLLNMPLLATAREETPALPWLMKAEGYTTIAMHPYTATNYQRDTIYPLLGFDRFLSLDDFEGAEMLRQYVTDRACYQKIISLYEQKAEDERLFVFNVTMQNHGDYRRSGLDQGVDLADGSAYPELEEYLNLMAVSDAALKELIQYFDQQQEPTIILLFGDHQPTMDLSMFAKNDALSDVGRKLTQYITPFVIWGNYPIESGYVEAVSINYLAPLLQQTAGLLMTGYDQWLLETAQQYPVAVISGYADQTGCFTEWEDGEWPERLQQMNHLRYNRLYDVQNRLPALDFIAPLVKGE